MGEYRDYRDYITWMKNNWIGKTVAYDGNEHQVVDVDYNGGLLINKPTDFTDTTAVDENMVEII